LRDDEPLPHTRRVTDLAKAILGFRDCVVVANLRTEFVSADLRKLYSNDVVVPGLLHVAFVRSDVASGTITKPSARVVDDSTAAERFIRDYRAALPGIDEIVGKRTQVNTIVANPFTNMALSSKIRPKNLTQDAPSLMVACGLAMRRVDP